jgi:two-component system, chemotaxis family, sensor histidine kinase and response regulator WspE
MSLAEMFKMDAEAHLQALTDGLLGLEQNPDRADLTEACMRAAHSIKGGARVVGIDAGVKVAHAIEDCFVSAQEGELRLRTHHIDILLQGIDLLQRIANTPEADMGQWDASVSTEIDVFVSTLAQVPNTEDLSSFTSPSVPEITKEESESLVPQAVVGAYRAMRVNAENLNRLLALAGESRVESQRLKPFSLSLQRLKKMHHNVESEFYLLAEQLEDTQLDQKAQTRIYDLKQHMFGLQQFLSERLTELDLHDRRSVDLSHRLYEEALDCRMRPFSDVTLGLPRMVRDLGRTLGKNVVLRIEGENTQVDRDVLQKLEAPLGHLLRNAVDHGIELPEDRIFTDKPEEGEVRLTAHHHAGMLLVTITDDGRGVDLERLRTAIVTRGLTNTETAATFGVTELLDFLFLPSFTMKETVTEISGRGVGLDVVLDMLKQVRGTVQINTEFGRGTSFRLRLPLTLSVLRTLLVNISGEPYAFPLAQISQALNITKNEIELLEGRQYFQFNGRSVGLVTANQVLELGNAKSSDELAVIVIGEGEIQYGLAVDAFLGEKELVVQRLDTRLGKIPNIASGSLMEDGSPVLIVDVEDMIRSVGKLISGSQLSKAYTDSVESGQRKRKRVLVVDDSLTVRELERKLLTAKGYEVMIAVDGMDGWNAVRTGHFDLVISDIDMPRMDGIEFVTLIKKHPHLKNMPVMVVSYKDREADKLRGLEAGADYYLAKSSFHDQTLLQAVTDLIGEADA